MDNDIPTMIRDDLRGQYTIVSIANQSSQFKRYVVTLAQEDYVLPALMLLLQAGWIVSVGASERTFIVYCD